MTKRMLDERMVNLERTVELCKELPSRMGAVEYRLGAVEQRLGVVELQVVQLRSEMREGFSAVRQDLRGEMAAMGTTLRGEMAAQGLKLRGEMRAMEDRLREEMSAIAGGLREEIRTGDEQIIRYMRVLHEDVLARLAAIQEGRPPTAVRSEPLVTIARCPTCGVDVNRSRASHPQQARTAA